MIRINKYGNTKITIRGKKFDSRKEAERFLYLEQLQKQGAIKELECQVKYTLIPTQYENGRCVERAWTYTADFTYIDTAGNKIVEDVKGYTAKSSGAYRAFVHARKFMRWRYGIKVIEV